MPVSKKRKRNTKKGKPSKQPNLLKMFNHVINDKDQPEEMKLSNKMLQLVEPWLDAYLDDNNIDTLLDMACIAWNMCVDEDTSPTTLDFLTNSFVKYDESDEMIRKLKERKIEMFPNDYRTIVRARIRCESEDDLRLSITSELKPKHIKKMIENFGV